MSDNSKAHRGKRQRERDRKKDAYMTRNGWVVLRFTEPEIAQHGETCVQRIMRHVNRLGGPV